MDTNTDYLAGMRSQLKQWDEAVHALVAESKKADGEARTAYERRLKELRLARKAAQRSFDEMRAATGAAVTRSQAGMQEAWETMQKTLAKVSSDLHPAPKQPTETPMETPT